MRDQGDDPIEIRALDPARRLALKVLSRIVLLGFAVVRRRRLQVGTGVTANHRLSIRGPGLVVIGDHANVFAHGGRTRLVTRRPGAQIRIGSNARLNGCFLQAESLIEVGADCIIGQAHILDTDIHSLSLDRRTNSRAEVRRAPVSIGRNVWVAKGAAILPGVRVGEGAVIGYGAVVTRDVPPRTLVAGNPARVIRKLG